MSTTPSAAWAASGERGSETEQALGSALCSAYCGPLSPLSWEVGGGRERRLPD